jgi:hypothetical protein
MGGKNTLPPRGKGSEAPADSVRVAQDKLSGRKKTSDLRTTPRSNAPRARAVGGTKGPRRRPHRRGYQVSDIFGEEAEDQITVLLQQSVLAPVAPVSIRAAQTLDPIHFDGDS